MRLVHTLPPNLCWLLIGPPFHSWLQRGWMRRGKRQRGREWSGAAALLLPLPLPLAPKLQQRQTQRLPLRAWLKTFVNFIPGPQSPLPRSTLEKTKKNARSHLPKQNVSENSGYITLRLHAPSSSQPSIHPSRHPAHAQSSRPAREQARKEASAAMEYWYPCNGGSGCSKEKRPPLKRGQLKLQIARTLLGSLAAPVAKNRDRGFGR